MKLSLFANENHTRSQSCESDSLESEYTAMSTTSLDRSSELMELIQSTLSRLDSLANHFPAQESEQAKMMKDTFGLSSETLLLTLDPDTQYWKTYQEYSQYHLWTEPQAEYSGKYSSTFLRFGIAVHGFAMPLPMLERRSNATECLSWPSPHGNYHTGAGEHGEGGINIQTAVKQWPTPSVCGNYNRKGVSATSGDGLATAVRNWPTPTAPNGGRSPKGGMSMTGMTPDGKKRQVDLQYAVRNWPTPAAQDAKNATLPPSKKNRDTIPGTVMRQGHTGSLNSDFVEILMGYDIGWTDIDCDDPQTWPGWPAGQGEYQHDYEPPRVITGQKNRAKRLKCLGNSVCAQQAYPIFKAIMELEEVQG